MGLRSDYKAFNNALCSLYGHDLLTLAKDETQFAFNDTRMEDAAKLIYENGGFDLAQLTTPEAQAIIEETVRVLETATACRMKYPKHSATLSKTTPLSFLASRRSTPCAKWGCRC